MDRQEGLTEKNGRKKRRLGMELAVTREQFQGFNYEKKREKYQTTLKS